jgi:hypothetical protein
MPARSWAMVDLLDPDPPMTKVMSLSGKYIVTLSRIGTVGRKEYANVTSIISSSLRHSEGRIFLKLVTFRERGIKWVKWCGETSEAGDSIMLRREAMSDLPLARRRN